MKKKINPFIVSVVLICTILLVVLIYLIFKLNFVKAENLGAQLKGKIVLQVQQNGEAWYINPLNIERYYMGRPNDAFELMRSLGIGITNLDLEKIQIADQNIYSGQNTDPDGDGLSNMFEDAIGTNKNNIDSDSDGYNDKEEILNGYNPKGVGRLNINNSFAISHKGKIFLQVENHGEAWYINPDNNKRYFLGRPDDAFNIMRSLGLGITDENLNQIVISENSIAINNPDNPIICSNECSAIGLTQCNGSGYQTCGNYDSDNCLEYGAVVDCTSGESCQNGECINNSSYECVLASTLPFDPCENYRCLVNGVTDGVCYSNLEQCNIICNSSFPSCYTNAECNDGDAETIDYCDLFDYNQCKYYPKPQCSLIGNSSASNNPVRFVFVPQQFNVSNFDLIKPDINIHINKILETEPFESNSNIIEFYLLETNVNFGYLNPPDVVEDLKLKAFVEQSCNAVKEIIVFVNKYESFGEGSGGGHSAITTIDDTWKTVHEIGHSFAALGDTYTGWIPYDGNYYINNTDFINWDEAGCPKWCSSYTQSYQPPCTQITDETQCRQYERRYTEEYGGHWACDDPLKCCVWLPEPDPYFGTRCVNFRDDYNIGASCLGDSGCYYGAFGSQMVWRSVNSDDIMTDDTRVSQEFSYIHRKAIEDVISCCYPQDCSSFPQQYCEELSLKYSNFNECTQCIL